jgi:type 1 glutamine amidotransferase/sugar phosphate isomerase/epimerase
MVVKFAQRDGGSMEIFVFFKMDLNPKKMEAAKSYFLNFIFPAIGFLLSVCAAHSQTIVNGQGADAFFSQIPENFKTQIERATPAQSVVQPVKKRKLLVFNFNIRDKEVSEGHPSIPYANYAIYQMGIKTGAFEVFFSRDTSVFRSEVLNQFEGIVLNNTVGVLFEDPVKRQDLLDYVYGGGGIMGIHGGAGATFVQYPVYGQFPEFGEMMGGYENGGHPWKTHEWITMKLEEPEHPLNIGFDDQDFNISDEIYQYDDPYSREYLRILISVNTEKTDMSASRRFLPARKIDNDFPVTWVRKYGRGRVFNSSLGHHPHINWDMRILDHAFRAIQFILGDLQVPTTPSNKLNASILAQEKLGWNLGLASYSYKNNTLFETIDHAADLGIWQLDALNVQKVSGEIDKNFDFNLSKEELLTIREKLIEAGVSITNYYIHDIPADRVECKKIFEFGKMMGIEAFISEPKIEALPMIDEFCQEYEIKLAIHNHGPDISPVYWNPERLLEAIKERSDWIGACGDIGYWQRNGIKPIEAISILRDKLITIQVHDLNENSRDGHDVPWGTGVSNLSEIFHLIANLKLKPTAISLEYSYNWGNSQNDIEKSKQFFDHQVIRIAASN